MGSRWRSLLSAATLAACCAAPGRAQQARELGVQLTTTASDPALAAAGPYAALRTSTRTRIAAALGVWGGEAAWRAELLGHFLLNPLALRGAGLYAVGGVAAAGGAASRASDGG